MTWLNTARGPVEIREIRSTNEMAAAETVQRSVWGFDFSPHPKEIMIPIQHEGGLVAGAFAGPAAEMVGMLFSFPTRDPLIQHSQLLAVVEEWRSLGIGAQMKWFQRRWCLERGIRLVRWTVDPLRAANAALNIHQLGATACTYSIDYYGPMQSLIDTGAPSDRLLAEWRLNSQRVIARAGTTPVDLGYPEAEPANAIQDGRPVDARIGLDSARILIHLPANFIHLSQTDPTLALEWRMQTRMLLLHYFTAGYQISEFTRTPGPAYLLEKVSHEDETE